MIKIINFAGNGVNSKTMFARTISSIFPEDALYISYNNYQTNHFPIDHKIIFIEESNTQFEYDFSEMPPTICIIISNIPMDDTIQINFTQNFILNEFKGHCINSIHSELIDRYHL